MSSAWVPEGWVPYRIRRQLRPGDTEAITVWKDHGKWWWREEAGQGKRGPFPTMAEAVDEAELHNPRRVK